MENRRGSKIQESIEKLRKVIKKLRSKKLIKEKLGTLL